MDKRGFFMSAQAQTAPPANIQKKPLDLSAVQPADIILTTSKTAGSAAIRYGSCGAFSHAILALKNGECIQAMPETGVKRLPLSIALDKASYAVQYRHKLMNPEHAVWVCHYGKEQQGKPYDYAGALRSGISSGCGITKYIPGGFIIELLHEKTQKRQHNDKFFCSELIVSAFEKAGLRLLNLPSHAVSPKFIAHSDKLSLVKELITA